MKLEGLVAVVTGGSSGLGEAAVYKLADAGCKIVIADINEEGASKVVSKIGKEKALFVKTDVTDESACNNLIEEAVKAFGGVHVVLNSAGVMLMTPTLTPDGTASAEDLLKLLKINVIGTFNVSKAAALQMTKQKTIGEKEERGVIINVASVSGIEGPKSMVSYSATKGAIIGMTLPLARDLGKFGIRVMTIAPGIFLTPMSDFYPEKALNGVKRQTPVGRIGDPPEFGEMVVSVAQNSFMTGEVIRLDGGYRVGHV